MEWSSKLEVRNKLIDTQHKELFRKIRDVIQASETSNGRLDVALDLLLEYCLMHFSAEENLQLKNGYKGYVRHKQLHTEFIEKLNSFILAYKKRGNSSEFGKTLEKVVVAWLVEHIAKEDQDIALHINKGGHRNG